MFAKPVFTALIEKSPVFLFSLLIFLTSTAVGQAQFFNQSGDFLYSLNSENHVFDITEDGTRAVSLTQLGSPTYKGLVTSFDPVTGQKFDSKTDGISPEEVRVVETASGTKVVTRNYDEAAIYDMDQAGKLTFRARKNLSNSDADFHGNFALSSEHNVGFSMVLTAQPYTPELVVFSLTNGAILKRLPISGYTERYIGLKEANGKSTLVYLHYPDSNSPPELVVLDVTNPAQPIELGPIQLSTSGGAYEFTEFAFTSDARYVFISNPNLDFTSVDLVEMKVADRLAANIVPQRMGMFETENQRILALQTFTANTQHYPLLLVDASDPANLQIIKQSNQFLEYLAFSKSGNQLVGLVDDTIKSLSVPSLATIWEKQIPDPNQDRPQQIMSFGQPGGVLGAWGINTSVFGSFPLREADLSIATYGAHGVLTGANINYYFRVINSGPTIATGVTLTDKLPAGLSLVSVTPSAGICGGTTSVICDFGDLPAGQSVTVKITATPTRTGTFINTASVKSSDLDPGPSNNKAAQSTTSVPLVLTLTPSTVYGPCQSSIVGHLSISSPAPSGGVAIDITNSNSSASFQNPVTIPAGKTSVDFPIQITPAANIRDGYLSAMYNGRGFGVRLTVLPRNGVQSLTLSPNPVAGGQTVTGRVRLACTAATDTVVTLSSSNTSVASPTMATINIPAGAIGGTFAISTADVSTLSTATITAKANSFSKSAILTVQ